MLKLLADWRALLETLPGWARVQRVFALLSLYAATGVAGYEFVRWHYKIDPPLGLYLTSYVFLRITVVFGAIFAAMLASALVTRAVRRDAATADNATELTAEQRDALRRQRLLVAARWTAVSLVAAFAIVVFYRLSPTRVSHIQVRFIGNPQVDRDALVYVVYELNRKQRNWKYVVDFTPLNPNALSTAERNRCAESPERLLCQVEALVGATPTIVVTDRELGQHLFWVHRGPVSVISTRDAPRYAPIPTLDYLAYCLITQSVAVHLDSKGSPDGPHDVNRLSRGDLLEQSPPPEGFKARLLSAHMDPANEQLLMNKFGFDYLQTCRELMTLAWLREIRDDIDRNFPQSTTAPAPSR